MPRPGLAIAGAMLLAAAPALAREPAGEDEARVPITASFPVAELATIGGLSAWYVGLTALQKPIVDARLGGTGDTSCDHCRFGPPDAVDRAISEALYRGPRAGALLGRVPDHLGLAIGPAITGLFYLHDAVLQWSVGHGVTGNHNADHELVALLEAFALAMGVNQTVKLATGRLRPYYELERGPSLPPPPDANLSFYSGHATASFTMAAFIYRDVSDWLVSHPLARSPSATRIAVGRILPAVGLYGAASLVAVSRIVDQAHYFSDVALGAATGAAIGNGIYALHFDGDGRPRRWRAEEVAIELVPLPGGLALAGVY